MRRRATLLTFSMLLSCTVSAAADYAFDRAKATELAATEVRELFAKYPQAAIAGVDFDHPAVVAVEASQERRLLYVSFDSSFAHWGAYAILELCGSRLVPNGVGKVIEIGDFRQAVAHIGPGTRLALPDVCANRP